MFDHIPSDFDSDDADFELEVTTSTSCEFLVPKVTFFQKLRQKTS